MPSLSKKILSRFWFLNSNSVADYVERDSIFVFHHIPKCGGTSFVYALRRWFSVVKDYDTTHLSPGPSRPTRINRLRRFQCLCGHFHVPGIYLYERYPETISSNRFKIFTLLRDPLETRTSLYYYEQRTRSRSKMSLVQRLLSEPNWIAGRFPCTAENYQDVLKRYFFIGILEYPQQSFDVLAKKIGKKPVILPLENPSPRDEQMQHISQDVIEEFKARNQLDYLIYNYAKEIFLAEAEKQQIVL